MNKQYPTKYPTDRFRYWTYALDETLPLYRVDVESITPDISDRFQRVIKRVIRAYAHDPYRARFIDKSQLYTINIEAVKKALNPSTPIFIVVTRNPYAMCKRVAEIYYKSRHKHGFGITTERSIRLCCQHWRNSYELALAASEKVENIKLYQFEKIILDPEKYIRSMCDFAQLNFEIDILPAPGQKRTLYGSMRSRWYPMRVNVNDNYLNELTGREIDIIYHECGKLAESLGYKKPYKNRKAVLGK
ncbi:hypothetical protein DSCA_23270 [Desulfosarcina alkanivorans]|uniref:Sulfotransferase family protein n=1 Tax=Desulfosarcina alkanivorans TaxID=571177 RepID=A0A5K7YUN8_9BACT|nr:hypothetical protein DSCA_23270 [Desulfosarcina alkanivorans]